MKVTASQWREAAARLHAGHPIFDHLGARHISADLFGIWLMVRDVEGNVVRLSTEISASDLLPTLADLWPGAAWCEREASEGYDLHVGETELLLLNEESQRGILRRERVLQPRQAPWPGSHEPSGRSRMVPLGRAES